MNTRKLSLILGVVAVASLMSISANAQGKGTKNRALANGRGGVGVDVLGLGNLISGNGSNIYVPILLNPQFRLEPSINFSRSSKEVSEDNNSETDTSLGFGVGIGAFYSWSPARHTAIYVGPRLGVQYSSQTNEVVTGNTTVTTDTTQTDINIGVGLGGEYFFASAFSLGAEAQLNFLIVGEPSTETSGGGGNNNNNGPQVSENRIGTNTQVFVRYYFF